MDSSLTPFEHLKVFDASYELSFTLAIALSYMDCKVLTILLLTPIDCSFVHSKLCWILSNTFFKSTKHTKRVELSAFVFSISVLRMKMQSVVLQFGLNPHCSSGRMPYVSVHSLSLLRRMAVNIFPKMFNKVIPQ